MRISGAFLVALCASTTLYVGVWAAPGFTYLALGDSYAAGVGSGGKFMPTTTTDFDKCCYRRTNAYGNVVSSTLGASTFQLRACSGAVSVGPTNSVKANQLKSLPSGVDLLTVTVGGDDIGFADVVTNCIKSAFSEKGCLDAVSRAEGVTETQLGANIKALQKLLRDTCPPTTTIAFTGYPLPYPGGKVKAIVCQNQKIRSAVNKLISDVNGVIKANVENFIPISFVGHELCRGKDSWFNALHPALENAQQCSRSRSRAYYYGGSYHPNSKGQNQYGQSVAKWYQAKTKGVLTTV